LAAAITPGGARPAAEASKLRGMRAGRRDVPLTHADKVLFPDDGITKADLAAYYRDVGPAMLEHVRDRPVSMQRYNAGIGREGFFQKDIGRGAPD
jgi:bifunctional non-homologous end joining protein LigD